MANINNIAVSHGGFHGWGKKLAVSKRELGNYDTIKAVGICRKKVYIYEKHFSCKTCKGRK